MWGYSDDVEHSMGQFGIVQASDLSSTAYDFERGNAYPDEWGRSPFGSESGAGVVSSADCGGGVFREGGAMTPVLEASENGSSARTGPHQERALSENRSSPLAEAIKRSHSGGTITSKDPLLCPDQSMNQSASEEPGGPLNVVPEEAQEMAVGEESNGRAADQVEPCKDAEWPRNEAGRTYDGAFGRAWSQWSDKSDKSDTAMTPRTNESFRFMSQPASPYHTKCHGGLLDGLYENVTHENVPHEGEPERALGLKLGLGPRPNGSEPPKVVVHIAGFGIYGGSRSPHEPGSEDERAESPSRERLVPVEEKDVEAGSMAPITAIEVDGETMIASLMLGEADHGEDLNPPRLSSQGAQAWAAPSPSTASPKPVHGEMLSSVRQRTAALEAADLRQTAAAATQRTRPGRWQKPNLDAILKDSERVEEEYEQ